ncbi:MAG: HAD family hydrolase [Candidatus Daviesbacteria bacterium]|nr:HAD family hydrolase [Candidatus Daviesbacteria bacterium]
MIQMRKKFAAFIDRDGTINLDVDNLFKIEDLVILPNVTEAITLLNKFSIPAIVITNQPVIARGLLTEEGVEEIHREIKKRLEKVGASIDGFYFCPHHPQANLEKYKIICDCRKPGTALYKQAAKDFRIDLKKSYIIGDSFRDIDAGKALESTTISVYSNQRRSQNLNSDYSVKNLYQAVRLILEKEKL